VVIRGKFSGGVFLAFGNPRRWPAFPVAFPLRRPKARTHTGTETVTKWGDGAEKGRDTTEDTTEEEVRDVPGEACRGDGSWGRPRGRGGSNSRPSAPLGYEGGVRPVTMPAARRMDGGRCRLRGRGSLEPQSLGPVAARGRAPLVAWGEPCWQEDVQRGVKERLWCAYSFVSPAGLSCPGSGLTPGLNTFHGSLTRVKRPGFS